MPGRRSQDRFQEQIFWAGVSVVAVAVCVWNLKSTKQQGKQPSWAQSAKLFFQGAPLVETQVTGLRNLGNTCFMNAVLQALGSSTHMLEAVSRGVHSNRLDVALSNESSDLASSLDFLQKFFALLAGQTNDPSAVHRALTDRVAAFRGFNQQDAHEFLVFVLDMLSDALGIKQAPPALDLSVLVREPIDNVSGDVCLPCTGLTSSSLICNMCRSASPIRLASFNVLSLSVPQSASVSLESCLRSYAQEETVEGVICAACSARDTLQAVREKKTQIEKNQKSTKSQKVQLDTLQNLEKALSARLRSVHRANLRYTDGEQHLARAAGAQDAINCDDLDPAFDVEHAMASVKLKPIEARRSFSKRLSFARAPPLLCLQIQRLFGEVKNSRFVPFPLKLDFSSFLLPSQVHSDNLPCSCKACLTATQGVPVNMSNAVYSLRAVVVHLGVSNSGHFITYRRMKKAGSLSWYYVSDEQVRPCETAEVLRAEAYLLFYEMEQLLV